MRFLNLLFLLLLAAILSANAFAQTADRARPNTSCPYPPGTAFTAEIRIALSDKEVQADSAVVRLNSRIPANGRTATDARGVSRYTTTLPTMSVRLVKDTMKNFSVAPAVVVENPNSPDCRLKVEPGISSRTWALNDRTNFEISAEVMVNGQSQLLKTQVFTSCFDEDTPIQMADGSIALVKQLVAGDVVRNPVTGAAVPVEEVIRGTQADESLHVIGYGSSEVAFTNWHPIMTRRGLLPASQVQPTDEVLISSGTYAPITTLRRERGNPARSVYNLRLGVDSKRHQDHLISAGGIVAGDFYLQEITQPPRITQSRPAAHQSIELPIQ